MSFVKDFFNAVEGVLDIPANLNPPIPDKDKIDVIPDVRYGRDEICLADLYMRTDRSDYPVLLYIHGGGFVAGDKSKRRGLAQWYASLGYFVVNINYGLAPDFRYPDPLRHLVDALNWMSDHAGDYGLDATKIVVSGDSAGAYYAAMLAVIVNNEHVREELGVECRARVGATVLNCGLYDIPAAFEQKVIFRLDDLIFENFTGCKYANFVDFAYRDLCSPLGFIDANFPPSFVIYAKKDLFCAGQAEKLLDSLHANGVYHESFKTEDLFNNHCFSLLWLNKHAQSANQLVTSFLHAFADSSLADRVLNEEDEFSGDLAQAPNKKKSKKPAEKTAKPVKNLKGRIS